MTELNKGVQWSIYILAFAALTWLLERTAQVLIPFTFAVFLYYIVYPVVVWVDRRFRVGHFLSVVIALLGFALVWSTIGILVVASVKKLIASAGLYQERVLAFHGKAIEFLSAYGIDAQIAESIQKLPLFGWASGLSGSVVGVIGDIGLVAIFMVFLLSGRAPENNNLLSQIQKQVTRYVLAKTLLSVLVGILVTITLWILDVEMAPLFGLIAYLTNFIPNIGGLIATLAPLPVVIVQHGFGMTLILAMTIPTALQFLTGNLLEARIIGNSLDLHPVTVLLALIFWGLVWGVVGMLLAVPIMAVLKIILERFPNTKRIAQILAGNLNMEV